MCKTSLYRKRTQALSLIYPVHDLYYFPSVGVVGLVEYVFTHSCLRGGFELCS
jgi:hypothetical protein